MPRSEAARAASDYFNSLPFEERKKLAPLLEDYRLLGIEEAALAIRTVTRSLDIRARAIVRRQDEVSAASGDLVARETTPPSAELEQGS